MLSMIEQFTSHFREHKLTTRNLKPYWMLLIEYFVLVLLSTAGIAGIAKETQDAMVCSPMTCDTSNVSSSLTKCSSWKAVILDTDYPYEYINQSCRGLVIHWFSKYFPFLLFLSAAQLLIFNNLFAFSKISGVHVERFVGIVNECNETVGKFSDVYCKLLGDEQDRKQLEYQNIDNGPDSEKMNLMSLHKKVQKFRNSLTPEYTRCRVSLTIVYVLQSIGQLFWSLVSFCMSYIYGIYFAVLPRKYSCQLQSFNMYETIECLYALHEIYLVLNFTAVVIYTLLIFLSAYHVYWTWYNSCINKTFTYTVNDEEGNKIENPETEEHSDFALLLKLLKSYDEFYLPRFCLFLNSKNNAAVERHLSQSVFSVTTLKNLTTSWTNQSRSSSESKLRLENLKHIPPTLKLLDPSVTRLDLVNCDFPHFPAEVLEMKHLTHLHLNNSNIRHIPENLFPGKSPGNDFNCQEQAEQPDTALECCVLNNNPLTKESLRALSKWTFLEDLFLQNVGHDNETIKDFLQNLYSQRKLHLDSENKPITKMPGKQSERQKLVSSLPAVHVQK